MQNRKDAYQIITDRIIAQLEAGVVPWRKPWVGGMPKNLTSGKEYRGINIIMLMDGATPYWTTYKQAQDLGGQVRRGEKGTPIIYWQMVDKVDPETGIIDQVPFARYYTVFNACQCDGLELPEDADMSFTHDPIARAEAIIANMPHRPSMKQGVNAFYRPSDDTVTMPPKEKFSQAEGYYSTLYHELAHSTAHPSRLNRPLNAKTRTRINHAAYAREELIAELAAAYLCGKSGISPQTIDNSSAYIDNWLQVFMHDSKILVQAASAAQKATDYILDIDHDNLMKQAA